MPLLEVPGFEADDVLGTLVDRVRDSAVDVVLVTADKDMLQLVGPRVRVFTTPGRGGERVVLDEAAVKVKMGREPRADPGPPRADGRLHRQYPRRARRRREDGGQAHRPVRQRRAPVREPAPGAGQAARDARHPSRPGAALARAGDGEHARAPRPATSRACAARSRTGTSCARSGPSSSSRSLLRQLPSAPAAAVAAEAAPVLAGPEALAAYLAKIPAGDAIAVEWAGDGGPPDPTPAALGLFHPAAGAATLVYGGAGERRASRLRRTAADRARRQAPGRVVARARRYPAGGRGHGPRRLSAQSGADQLPAGGSGGRAARRGAGPRPAGEPRAMDLGAVGDGPARARERSGSSRSTRTSSGRWCPCSRTWSATGSASTGAARRVLARARGGPRAGDAGDLRARGRRVQHRLAQAAREHPVRQARAAAACGRPRPATRPTPTCSSSSPSATSCPPRSSSTGRSPSSSPRTSTRCPTLVNPRTGRVHTDVQPGRRRDGAALVERSEPAEHPDPHRARPADPRGVRAASRATAARGRLLADRAAHPRAPLGRGRACRGLPARRGHPPAHRGRGVRRRRSTQVTASSATSPRRSTTPSSTAYRLRPLARARHDAAAGAGVPRQYFARPPRVKEYLERTVARAASAATSRRCSGDGAISPSCGAATRPARPASAWRRTRPSRARRPIS